MRIEDNQFHHVDLSYLNRIAKGDEEFIKGMIQLYLINTTQRLKDLDVAIQSSQYEKVLFIAHELKSSGHIMGVKDLFESAEKIQSIVRNGKFQGIEKKLEIIKIAFEKSIEELKKAYFKLQ